MPAFLEAALKHEASKKGFTGRKAAAYVYGTLNNIGAMHGNKETRKGAAMQVKHNVKVASVKRPRGIVKARGAHPSNPDVAAYDWKDNQ